jgi:hypothetical protein
MPKAMWFFAVNLAERKNNHLLVDKIDELRNAFRYVKQRKPLILMPSLYYPIIYTAFGHCSPMTVISM